MDNIRNTNKRVDEILSSLDKSQRASVPNFFYTRLKARMENGLITPPKRSWTLRPVYALTALALLFVLNGAILLQGEDKPETTADNTISTETDNAQSVAAEYSLNDNSTIYELNSEK